jgi:hypothetical protein
MEQLMTVEFNAITFRKFQFGTSGHYTNNQWLMTHRILPSILRLVKISIFSSADSVFKSIVHLFSCFLNFSLSAFDCSFVPGVATFFFSPERLGASNLSS